MQKFYLFSFQFVVQDILISQNFSRYKNSSRKQIIPTVRAFSLPNEDSFMFFHCKVFLAFHWHKNIQKTMKISFLFTNRKRTNWFSHCDLPPRTISSKSDRILKFNSAFFQFLTNKTLIKWRISRNVHCARVCYQINWWSSGVFFSVFSLHCILVVNLFSSQIIRGFQSLHLPSNFFVNECRFALFGLPFLRCLSADLFSETPN